ncbi:MAG TPA: hypothetical protein VEB21_02400, partial [Terriglobales bacterium]|nr:hypothetical protein [Terriglobales bacterium]
ARSFAMAYTQTHQHQWIERAESVARGIEPLWHEERGAYAASAAQRGDDGHFSLSTNSYAAEALLALRHATGQNHYRSRAERIVDFIRRELFRDGIALAHVHRGRAASGDIWCSGCNWRLLGLLWRLGEEEDASAGTARAVSAKQIELARPHQ